MLNINTLDILNRVGFGANINKLESYIIDFTQASCVSDLYRYKYDYNQIYSIYSEVSKSSYKIDNNIICKRELDKNDKLYNVYRFVTAKRIFGKNDKSVKQLCDYVNTKNNKSIDIIAIPYVQGLGVKCTYVNGYIYRIELVYKGNKYTDLTKLLKNKVPDYIAEFKDYETVECVGKITIIDNKKHYNIICDTMHNIRLGINLDNVHIIIDDLLSEKCKLNTWEKLELLRRVHFSVPHHALIRNVDEELIKSAIEEFYNYFTAIENTSGINYKYDGYELRNNNESIYEYDGIENDYSNRVIYTFNNCSSDRVFKSKLKSVLSNSCSDLKPTKIKIIETNCNDNLKINEVSVHDIMMLDTYDLKIGSTINFIINNGEAILTDNKNI